MAATKAAERRNCIPKAEFRPWKAGRAKEPLASRVEDEKT
jgi:hypothetical protein